MPARLRLSWGMKTLKQFLLLVLESFEFGWQVIRYALIFVSAFFRQRTSLGFEMVPATDRLGVCFNGDEGQAAVLARHDVATVRKAGGHGSQNNKTGCVSYISSHVYDPTHAKQRGRKSCTRASSPRQQSDYARPVRASGNGREARSTAESCRDGVKEGEGSGLTGP